MNKLAKNSISNMIYSAANMVFPLIMSMYVSRILQPEGVGQVSYAQNITSYFLTFAALGLPTYGIREIARVRENQAQTDRVFTELMIISGITTAAASLAFLIFAGGRELYLYCGIPLFLNCINIDWFYRGREEYGYIVCRSLVIKLMSLGAVLLLVKDKDDCGVYALISGVASAGNYLFNIIHARKYVRFRFKNLQISRHMGPLAVFAASSFLGSLYSRLDVTMLGTGAGDHAVGLYTNAHNIANAVIALCTAVSTAFLPRLSYCYAHDRDEFLRLVEKGIRAVCFFAIPLAVGVFLLSPAAVELAYGEAFSGAAVTLRIFSALIVIQGFGNLLCYQLAITTGSEKKRLPAYAAAALLNALLNGLLIPRLAQNGAAMASVVSELLLNAVLLVTMRRIVPYRFDLRALVQALAGSGFLAVYILLIGRMGLSALGTCVISVVGGILIYFGVNLLMKNELLRRHGHDRKEE